MSVLVPRFWDGYSFEDGLSEDVLCGVVGVVVSVGADSVRLGSDKGGKAESTSWNGEKQRSKQRAHIP